MVSKSRKQGCGTPSKVHSLKLTWPLKMDGWKMNFLLGFGLFAGAKMLVLGRVLTLTWRIILVSKWLVTTIYKPVGPFVRGTTLLRGLTNPGY